MEKYNPHKHHRRSIRMVGYDYSQAGLYFVTLICQNRAHLFGAVIDGVMHLNNIGQILADEWLHTEQVREIPFKLEKDIQNIFETNLNILTGLKFINRSLR